MLEKIKNKNFIFLWTGKREKKGTPLVKSKNLAKPKVAGGWGLKISICFDKDWLRKVFGGVKRRFMGKGDDCKVYNS
jgi:hypothetical protein